MPAPGLDTSMKKAINTVIQTKLQEQEEREIGLVTPVNPKSGMKAPQEGVRKHHRFRPGTVALKGSKRFCCCRP